ncbi:MAG: GntR family transcriptional regulator [Aestuariivita sp.]|uniref:GntR family transcriptional regulator n=1 Tax=Aestuariivita sp. TaxID=1872407 RepID=UPI003BB08212
MKHQNLAISPIDRSSPLPLYLQIRQQLVAMISDWPDPAVKFHTDEELATHFDVAKATVRQAIVDLTDQGLLKRRRGAGTFVVPPLVERLRPNMDIEDPYELTGAAVMHRVHALDRREATPAESRALALDDRTNVVFLRRVRSVAHVPVAVDDRVMAADMAERLGFDASTAAGSIINLVRKSFTLSKAAWELNARLAGMRDAMLLQIAPSDPILVRSLVYFAKDGTPILTGETRHRSDMIRCGFEMDLSAPTNGPGAGTSVRSWTSEALLATPSLD